MFDKLLKVKERLEKINQDIMDPDIINDTKKYAELMKEYTSIKPIVDKYDEYVDLKNAIDEARSIMDESGIDKDFKEMAVEQYNTSKDLLEKVSEELKILLVPKDPNDDKNVIIEIRGGAGGEESALFVNSLFRMYTMYAEKNRWKTEVLSSTPTGIGGYKEISFSVDGAFAYSKLKFESGVHRVQRVPETEASGRIHTSTVTVAVLVQAEDVEIEINNADLQIDTFRAGGAGGQHVNKTESAIRITHIPSGVIVECQDERSQHKNKEKAMKILRSRIYEIKQKEQEEKIASERKSQVGTGDRSERIRTYNYPQGRVTDHRISLTLYKLEDFLNGSIDEIVDALNTAYQTQKMQSNE